MPGIVEIIPALLVQLLRVILRSLKISRKKPQKGHFPPEAQQRKDPAAENFNDQVKVLTPYGPNAP
jgi:hypothetical protein